MNRVKKSVLDKNRFIDLMSKLWLSHDNVPAPRVESAWNTIYECFNNQLSGKPGLHVSDSVCGTGKTLGVKAACSVLSHTQPTIGGLIVTRFISEANDIADVINSYSGGDAPAFSYHSELKYSQRKDFEALKDKQFIIITHKSYIAALGNRDKMEVFKNWKYGERQFRVVDESLDLVERHSITKTELQKFISRLNLYKDLRKVRREFRDHFDLLDDVQDFLEDETRTGTRAELYEKVLSNYGDNIYLSEIWEDHISRDPQNWILEKIGFYELKTEIEDFISIFDRVVRQEVFLSKEYRTKDSKISIGELILPQQFDSLCILDATSNVDKIYSLFADMEETFTRYSVPKDVRNFGKANLHIMPCGTGLGKNTWDDRETLNLRSSHLLKWAEKKFSPEDKVLFVGHKDQMKKFRAYLEKRNPNFAEYDCAHWGAIDGKNTWVSYNKLVITSLLYLPPEHSPTAKLAFKTRMLSHLEIDGSDSIASSATAVSLIQLICRIRIRKVDDASGNCKSSDIYLPLAANNAQQLDYNLRLNKVSRYLLQTIKDSLHNINVKPWDDFSFAGKPPKEGEEGVEVKLSVPHRFVIWLENMQPGEIYNLKDFNKNITKKESTALRVSFTSDTSLSSRYLQTNNIVKESNYSGTKFYYKREE